MYPLAKCATVVAANNLHVTVIRFKKYVTSYNLFYNVLNKGDFWN